MPASSLDRLFDFPASRRLGLQLGVVEPNELTELLAGLGEVRADYTKYAMASIQTRLSLALLPLIPDDFGFNQRVVLVEKYLAARGFSKDIDYTEATVGRIIDLCNRVSRAIQGARKTSWADLHYKIRHELLSESHGRCSVCGVIIELSSDPTSPRRPEIDHIIPFALGGNKQDNLRLVCKRCNTQKGQDVAPHTSAEISQNQFYVPVGKRRIEYWVFERDGSKCTTSKCQGGAHNSKLFTQKYTPPAAISSIT